MTAITRKTVKIISHSPTHFHLIPLQVSLLQTLHLSNQESLPPREYEPVSKNHY